jgi:hypothetical protein
MNKIFKTPYYFDWLFYYSLFVGFGYFSNFLDFIRVDQGYSFAFFGFTTMLGLFVFIGIPLIIRYNLKNKRKTGIEFFTSFSTNDRLIVEMIIDRLSSKTPVTFWMQSKIELGEDFHIEISDAINRSAGCIIFNSSSFQNSKFIQEEELPLLGSKYESGKYKVIPLLLEETSDSEKQFFNTIQSLGGNSKPLYRARMEEFNDVVQELIDDILLNVENKENKPLRVILNILGWILAGLAFTGQFISEEIIDFLFFIF